MVQVSVNKGLEFPSSTLLPSDWGSNAGYGYTTLDAAGERFALIGQVFIDGRPGSTKTFGGGSSALAFLTGATVFANGSTALDIGMQDLTDSKPTVPDGTFDCKITLTGNASPPLTTDAWNSKSFGSATGTKSVSHGDKLAIVFDMTARAGSDSVVICAHNSDSPANNPPYTIERIGGVWQATLSAWAKPLAMITFSDGTIGWFYNCTPVYTQSSYSFTNADNPDEYGLIFQVPWNCKIDAINAAISSEGSSASDCVLGLYSDPLGTPTLLTSIAIDGDQMLGTYVAAIMQFMLASEISLSKDTDYALSVRATSTGALQLGYGILGNESYRAAFPNGLTLKQATRNNNTGVFTAQNPAVHIPRLNVHISAFEASGGSGGVKTHPGMTGNING